MFQSVDRDANGSLDFSEFEKLYNERMTAKGDSNEADSFRKARSESTQFQF